MIVATAGHIDHGKTSLVKALTGVDTDRLPEEKKRGLSIDLGFAYTGGGSLGFVDVPGHERFVRNMIAGVTAIDCALLVVAADDGVMPQTREHLAILDLLGVKSAVVALTKIDRASPARIDEVRLEIDELLAPTSLAGARIFPVSSQTGDGIAELRDWLDRKAQGIAREKGSGHFRMAVDRAFIIEGAGVVVTGAVSSGDIGLGDRLMLCPQGIEVRVRGIHAQNRKADRGRAGERCAVNIAAPRLSLDLVTRGDWLVAPEIHAPTQRFDARINVLESEARTLRHWTPAHLHIGAGDFPARIAVLEGNAIEPGGSGLVQIVLQSPVPVLYADRFVLRDQSGQRTLGGGSAIDPFAPARGRARPQRLAVVLALEQTSNAKALAAALDISPGGFAIGEFFAARNVVAGAEGEILGDAGALRICGEGRGRWALSATQWDARRTELVKALEAAPQGLSRAALHKGAAKGLAEALAGALLDDLVKKGDAQFANEVFRPRGQSAQLDPKDNVLWGKLEKLLDSVRPPSIAELAAEVRQDQRIVERLLQRVARMGLAVQIAPNRYYKPERLRELAAFAQAVAKETPGGFVSIRAFRDKSGIGRNVCVEALEYFDRLGFTARAGEHRKIFKLIDQVKWVRGAG